MSDIDGLQLDPDGFVDMSQFPDDTPDLGAEELADLRTVLHSDPVEEPTPEAWDAMFAEVLSRADDGPFDLDDGVAPDLFGEVDATDLLAHDATALDGDDDRDDHDHAHHDGDDGHDHDGSDTHDGDIFGAPDHDGVDDGALTAHDLGLDTDVDLDLDVDVDGAVDGLDHLTADGTDDGLDLDIDLDVDPPTDLSHDLEDTL